MSKVSNAGALVRMECEVAFITKFGTLRGSNEWAEGLRTYVVYSYEEPIARVSYLISFDSNSEAITKRDVWVTDERFTSTTTNHISMARRALHYGKGDTQ